MIGQRAILRLLILVPLTLPLSGCFFLDWFTVETEAKPSATISALPEKWDVVGRIGVVHGDEGWHGKLDWTQVRDSFNAKISGPFGGKQAELISNRGSIELKSPNGETISGSKLAAWQKKVFGSSFPVKALPYWMHGLPYPKIKDTVVKENEGTVHEINQDGWKVGYSRWRKFGNDVMPGKIARGAPADA